MSGVANGARDAVVFDRVRASAYLCRFSNLVSSPPFLVLPVLIVQATIRFAIAILAEAGLSYLGLGTAPPAASWGRMLQDSQSLLGTAPLQAFWPGLAIAATVLGFNLLGDALRDLLDPRLKGSAR